MKKKKITLKGIICFLETKKALVNSVRTSKYPKVLPPKEVLIKARKLITELIDRWLSYESHVLTTKMMYEAEELEEKYIKEYWHVLKDIKIKERKEMKPKSKMSTPKKRSAESLLDELRAFDDRPRGHI